MKHIKLFEEFIGQIDEKKGDSYEYGCVMLYFGFDKIKDLHSKIEESDLYTEEEDRTYGLEDEPHCTLLYGLHEEVTIDDIKEIVRQFQYDKLKLHNASLFENQYDVLKFDVGYTEEGNNFLHACNDSLCKLPHTNSYPDYHPHMTIAYIKKGLGQKYVDMFKGVEYQVSPEYIVYSQPNGEKIKIEI